MKLIIDIPNYNFDKVQNGSIASGQILKAIKNGIPYEERPQGEWIVTTEDNDGVHRICCPFCSYEKGSNNTDPIIVTFSNFPKFCERCGASMKGGAI